MMTEQTKKLNVFERYLTVWVLLCIVGGIVLGKLAPGAAQALDGMAIMVNGAPVVSIPIAIALFFMMYPIMVKIDFAEVVKAGTEVELFRSYISGAILLGIAPCTAMVLMWGYLARGNQGLTLVMVAINSLTMLVLYGVLGGWLLGVNKMPVP